jgi:hypothetical protein
MIPLVVVVFDKIFNGFSKLRWGIVVLQLDEFKVQNYHSNK